MSTTTAKVVDRELTLDRLARLFKQSEDRAGFGKWSYTLDGRESALAILSETARNPEYIGRLNSMIADDCIRGLHKDEYVLDESGAPSRTN